MNIELSRFHVKAGKTEKVDELSRSKKLTSMQIIALADSLAQIPQKNVRR